MLVLGGIRFLWFKPAGAAGDFETHPEPAVGLGWMSKPEPLRLQHTRTHPLLYSPCYNSPFLLPYLCFLSPALALRLLCFTVDVLGLLPGLRHTGGVGSCLFFPWREAPKPLRDRGERAGGEAQGGVSPAQRFPALPAVFGGLGSPFCLAQATARRWEERRAVLAPLACTQVWRGFCPSSGTAWLCLPGGIPAAGPRGTALGPGNLAKGMSQSGGRGVSVPTAQACSGSDSERHEKGTLTPGNALCLAVCFLNWV